MIARFRSAPRTPVAVAAILAAPIFFVALMAMSLALEKPTMHGGKPGDPSGANEAGIWLLAIAIAVAVVAIGALAMLIGRKGIIVSAAGAVAAAVALMIPIGTWQHEHASRYPIGVDLLPKGVGDLYLRGEWEQAARHTAVELGVIVIAMAVIAVVVYSLLEYRRRSGPVPPPAPPPPETGQIPGPLVT